MRETTREHRSDGGGIVVEEVETEAVSATELAALLRPEEQDEVTIGVDSPPASVEAPRSTHATFPLERSKPRSTERSFGRRFLRDLGRGIVIVFLLHAFVVQISVVRGLSMQPCLHDGDRLVVDRLSYTLSDVERYDVVVLRNPRDTSVDYVKRIVGLPGESVSIEDGRVSIDGRELSDSPDLVDDHAYMAEVIVPDGHFFVLGDNRPVSCDSREFGLVRSDLLKGKVRLRFWPLERFDVF